MDAQNLIQLKKRVLGPHVEFIEKMLSKKLNSDLSDKLKHMLECITLDKKK